MATKRMKGKVHEEKRKKKKKKNRPGQGKGFGGGGRVEATSRNASSCREKLREPKRSETIRDPRSTKRGSRSSMDTPPSQQEGMS